VQQVGRYRIEGELARGGAGVVYRARDPESGEPVAIKLLLGGQRTDERARKRFLREAQALAKLDHPHVVRVRDVGAEGERPYLVMDYAPGDSLAALLEQRGPLEPERAAELARQLARGVEHAHARGVLHRDLKPDNVLLSANGQARLTDFGLVRELVPSLSSTRLSQTGQLMGTPGYWPPEQALGELDAVGPRSDVYGLGAVLYALLTGVPPHESGSLVEALARATQPPRAPRQLRAEIPARLEAICLRCLAPAPERRYPSAAAVAEALETWLDGGDAPASRAPALAAGLLLLGAGVAGATLVLRARPPAPAQPSLPASLSPAAPTPAAANASPERPPTPDPEQVTAWVERALDRHISHHGHLAALEAVADALERAPEDPAALATRGLIRLAAGLPGAEEDLARARRHPTPDRLTLRALVWAANASGDASERDALLATWEALHPGDPFLRLAQCLALPAPERLPTLQALVAEQQNWALAWVNLAEHFPTVQDALAAHERALQLDPDNVRALTALGRALHYLGRPRESTDALERAVAAAPRSTIAHVNRAELLRLRGDHRQAAAAARVLLQADPNSAIGWSELAESLTRLGQHDEALDASQRALSLAPEVPVLLARRARQLAQLQRYDDAFPLAREALRRDPQNHLALWVRGTQGVESAAFDDAIRDFGAAQRGAVAAEDADTLRQALLGLEVAQTGLAATRCRNADEACTLGALLLSGSSPASASAAYRVVLAMEPKNARALAGLGLALLRAGGGAGGDELRQAQALDPRGLWPRLRAAQAAELSDGEVTRAQRLLEALLIDYPGEGSILRARMAMRMRAQDHAGVRDDLAAALADEDDPLRGVTLLAQARMRMVQGDLRGALRDLRRARQATPDHALIETSLAEVSGRLGLGEESLEAANRAVQLAPTQPLGYRHRAAAAAQLGRFRDAQADAVLHRLLEPSPSSWRRQARVARGLNDLAEAQRALSHAIVLDPRDPWSWADVAGVSLAIGDTDSALEQSRRAVALGPAVPAVGLTRLEILVQAGRRAEAAAELGRVRGLGGLTDADRAQLDALEARLASAPQAD
jgi:tetratricopeptide (TPR) repeat protein/predicted Ser/Thr protein kinase